MATTGSLRVVYEVIPVGAADLPSSGTANQHNNLPSTGQVPYRSGLHVTYEVFERPKVTVGFNPAADAFVLDYTPALNYGDLADLVAGRYDSKTARALLRFDISSLRTDLIIVEAKLVLVGRIISGTGWVEAHEAISSWDELGVTWYNQPGRSPLTEDVQPMADVIELDVTRLFNGWYAGVRANNGVAVFSTNESAEAHIVIPSREWPAAMRRPQLLVTYYAPEGTPESSELPSQGSVIGHTQSDLPSSGAVGGDWNDLASKGVISRPHMLSMGNVRATANLPSTGTIRGTRVAYDFESAGHASRPILPSQGVPRVFGQSDLAGAGYAAEHNDLSSTGRPRVPEQNDFLSGGQVNVYDAGGNYIGAAAGEIPSKGVVDYYFSDLPSQGSARVSVPGDLPATGYVSGGANELPSRGHATGPWMRSSGTVRSVSDLYSKGKVRVAFDLNSTGFVTYSGESDLPAGGRPRLRDAFDLWSSGYCRSFYSDLPCKGHVGAWILEVKTTAKVWPPEGRSVFPPA